MSSDGEDPVKKVLGGAVAGVSALVPGFFHSIDETVGEISGRNYQRQQTNEQNDLAATQRAQDAQLELEKNHAMQTDIAASKTAQALQRTARGKQLASTDTLGAATQKDFLGL